MEQSTEKKKIVIIDDEASFLKIFSKLLEEDGFDVVGYQNPSEALSRIVNDNPDAVLIDIMMPGLNGFEVYSHLRTNIPGKQPKLLFFTNLDATEAGEKIGELAQTIGAGYIKKGDDLNVVVKSIKDALVSDAV